MINILLSTKLINILHLNLRVSRKLPTSQSYEWNFWDFSPVGSIVFLMSLLSSSPGAGVTYLVQVLQYNVKNYSSSSLRTMCCWTSCAKFSVSEIFSSKYICHSILNWHQKIQNWARPALNKISKDFISSPQLS